MKGNFILYGPNHSGKSTLAGFILTKDMSLEELLRNDQKIMNTLGAAYDPEQRFAYYVDTAKDERTKKANNIGTSKHIHYQQVNMEDKGEFLLIDSPGSSARWKQKYKGYFLGDIGVLIYNVASFKQLAGLNRGGYAYKKEREKLLWQIELWKEYKNLKYLIIAISKMDGENQNADSFSRILYANAIAIIKSDPELQEVPVIPIAIDRKNRIQHNIYTKSSLMNWYTGETLISVMEQKGREFLANCIQSPYAIANIVEKLHIRETKEPVFRIKVLSGEIKKGDTLVITQVKDQYNTGYACGQITIKSMKPDKDVRTDKFTKGTIGGVTLSKIVIGGKSVAAENIELSRSSFIIDKKMKIKTGNILCLQFRRDPEQFYDFNLKDKINILMFGKIISCVLVGKWCCGEKCYLNVYAKNYPLVLPVCDDGEMALPNYVIEQENMDFLGVKLMDISLLDEHSHQLMQIEFDQEFISQEEAEELFYEFPTEKIESHKWVFRIRPENIEIVAAKLRNVLKKNHIYDYSVKLVETAGELRK